MQIIRHPQNLITPRFSPRRLFRNGEAGVSFDPSAYATAAWQDSAGTIPATAPGQTVGKIDGVNGLSATQATASARPILSRYPASGIRNLLNGAATQSVTVTAVAHTLTFYGTGTVTLSGASSAGPLVGTGVDDRVSLTFMPTAGALTLTVSGTITSPQLEIGSSATAAQTRVSPYDITEAGQPDVWALKFDGIDDFLVTPSIDFTGTDKMTVFAGVHKTSDAATQMLFETSTAAQSNDGAFYFAPTLNGGSGLMSFLARGTTPNVRQATLSAPASFVMVGAVDIAAPSTALKINGASAVSVSSVGTGNFGNYPVYIGMRAGTSFPFSGYLTGLTVLGRTATDAEIARMERLYARKTGVTL